MYFKLPLSRHVSVVLFPSLVFTSPGLNFPQWQHYANPMDSAMYILWEPQPVHLEELKREPVGKTPAQPTADLL